MVIPSLGVNREQVAFLHLGGAELHPVGLHFNTLFPVIENP